MIQTKKEHTASDVFILALHQFVLIISITLFPAYIYVDGMAGFIICFKNLVVQLILYYIAKFCVDNK